MAVPTPAQMVETIDTTIASIVTGAVEEVSMGGRTYRASNLDQLKGLRKFYAQLAAEESNPVGFAIFAGRVGRG